MRANLTVDKFQPLADYVLLLPIEAGTTEGGIALPDGADLGPSKAHVVKVGPGRMNEEGKSLPMPVEKGQTVFCLTDRNPMALDMDGKKYVLTRARDLIAVCEK